MPEGVEAWWWWQQQKGLSTLISLRNGVGVNDAEDIDFLPYHRAAAALTIKQKLQYERCHGIYR